MAREAKTDKILVLGVDGMDLRLTKKFMDQGKLPHIKEYVERGACREDLILLGAMPTITRSHCGQRWQQVLIQKPTALLVSGISPRKV